MDESLTKQTPKNPFRIEQIHREHLRIVYDAMPLSLVANFINGSILATLQWPVIEHGIVLAWLAAIWLLSAARLLLVVRFRSKNSPALQIKAWSIAAQAGVMLSAACWGAASYFLFAVDSLPHQVFLAFVIAGMVAGSVATLSALPWCAIAFILLSTVPLLYRFSQAPHSFALPMSLMILLFILMMIPLAMQICRNLTEMLTERFEKGPLENNLPVRAAARYTFEGIVDRAKQRRREIGAFLRGLDLARTESSHMDSHGEASLQGLMEWAARLEKLIEAEEPDQGDYAQFHRGMDQLDHTTESLLVDVEQTRADLVAQMESPGAGAP